MEAPDQLRDPHAQDRTAADRFRPQIQHKRRQRSEQIPVCGEEVLAIEDRCALGVDLLASTEDVRAEAGALFRGFEVDKDEAAVVLARVLDQEEAPDLVAELGR